MSLSQEEASPTPATEESAPPPAPAPRPAAVPAAPAWMMWLMAVLLIVASGWIYWSKRPPVPVPAVPIEGLRLEVTETQSNGAWFVEGWVRNGPADVGLAQFGLTYTDAQGNVVAMASIEVRNLKAAQTRTVKAPLAGYTPGLTRSIVPIRFQRPDAGLETPR